MPYYTKQGVPKIEPIVPFFGNLFAMVEAAKENSGTNEHPWNLLMKKYFKDHIPKMYIYGAGYALTLFIQDPDMC